ncbi:Oidioi.mRNA.OKI2018_I69.chr2.g6154.t1.cds [Oikopleura dioica]|uniref:Oidioi.mRNA.OKI2018_I69.chr2.g6154.t1.cds n=1 Tax=Oikopleura dioica TaxID=34765 RepID=A0ABN7T5Z6_OIKDI|nr:Oidioi.mRNA.OKI2018_I69.chr2.g6154.t1.cds [Oikopleura dioica]
MRKLRRTVSLDAISLSPDSYASSCTKSLPYLDEFSFYGQSAKCPPPMIKTTDKNKKKRKKSASFPNWYEKSADNYFPTVDEVGKSIASVIAPKSPTEPHGSPIPKTVKSRSLLDVAANEILQRAIPSFNPHSPKNGRVKKRKRAVSSDEEAVHENEQPAKRSKGLFEKAKQCAKDAKRRTINSIKETVNAAPALQASLLMGTYTASLCVTPTGKTPKFLDSSVVDSDRPIVVPDKGIFIPYSCFKGVLPALQAPPGMMAIEDHQMPVPPQQIPHFHNSEMQEGQLGKPTVAQDRDFDFAQGQTIPGVQSPPPFVPIHTGTSASAFEPRNDDYSSEKRVNITVVSTSPPPGETENFSSAREFSPPFAAEKTSPKTVKKKPLLLASRRLVFDSPGPSPQEDSVDPDATLCPQVDLNATLRPIPESPTFSMPASGTKFLPADDGFVAPDAITPASHRVVTAQLLRERRRSSPLVVPAWQNCIDELSKRGLPSSEE